MVKGIITISVDEPAEVEASEEWFSRWRTQLKHVSENKGCGCCLNSWEVEGPPEAINEIIEKGIGVLDEPEKFSYLIRKLRRARTLGHIFMQNFKGRK